MNVQETPDTPEALACVPTLAISDIPKEASSIPSTLEESQGVQLLSHELFTNDVLYMEVALDMKPLPADLLPLMPLFCRHARSACLCLPTSCLSCPSSAGMFTSLFFSLCLHIFCLACLFSAGMVTSPVLFAVLACAPPASHAHLLQIRSPLFPCLLPFDD